MELVIGHSVGSSAVIFNAIRQLLKGRSLIAIVIDVIRQCRGIIYSSQNLFDLLCKLRTLCLHWIGFDKVGVRINSLAASWQSTMPIVNKTEVTGKIFGTLQRCAAKS